MRVRGPATYTLAMQHGRCNPEPPFSAHPVARMLSSELVRSVLDSAPDAMIVIDSGGTILFANTQVTALFGFAIDEVVGSPVEMLMPQRFRTRHTGHRASYGNNVRVRPMGMGLDLFGVRKDGSEFPVEISLSPITQGGNLVVAAAIRDVTERKRAERALQEARQEAERANLAKSRFLATASHDLRQPVHALTLFVAALRPRVSDQEARRLLDHIDSSVQAMGGLFNGLLDISRLDAGVVEVHPQTFAMQPLLERICRDYAGAAEAKKISLTLRPTTAAVYSDPLLVERVVRNIVANAITYTDKGGVLVGCRRRGNLLRVQVWDTGRGIPEAEQSRVFIEFYQVANPERDRSKGVGLGLAICRAIVEAHRGRIWAEANTPHGAVFTFTLPLGSPPPVDLAEAEDAAAAAAPTSTAGAPA